MSIPFAPPYIDQDVIDEVVSSLKSGWITTGPKVKALGDAVVEYTLPIYPQLTNDQVDLLLIQ